MNKKYLKLKSKLTKPIVLKSVLILGAILLALATYYLLVEKNSLKDNDEPLITYSTDSPDESKERADNYNWRGLSDEPKRIKISKIGVDSFVQKAGVDQNNKVAVPSNVHLAGWFADSVKPGQKGLSVISGHVSGKSVDGVFKELGKVIKGDEFQIELGSGEIKNYRVVDTKQVKESESAAILFNQDPKISSQVNLITCSGNFDRGSNQYEDRIIVSAELLQA